MSNINGFLRDIFAAHDVVLTPRDEWLVSGDAYPCCRSYVHEPREYRLNYSVRVDVEIALDSERSVIESFGDVGSSPNEALTNGCRNFSTGSFHVLLSAVWGRHDDEQVSLESWMIDSRPWRAFIGNFVCKSSDGARPSLPDDFKPTIEALVAHASLSQRLHWLRVYVANVSSDNRIVEVLLDNETWEDAQNAIRQLDWQVMDSFYSARLFLMFAPADGDVAE